MLANRQRHLAFDHEMPLLVDIRRADMLAIGIGGHGATLLGIACHENLVAFKLDGGDLQIGSGQGGEGADPRDAVGVDGVAAATRPCLSTPLICSGACGWL